MGYNYGNTAFFEFSENHFGLAFGRLSSFVPLPHLKTNTLFTKVHCGHKTDPEQFADFKESSIDDLKSRFLGYLARSIYEF